MEAPYNPPLMNSKVANKWFYGVDSLRFILAFIVMLSHFNNLYIIALKHSSHVIFRYTGYFLANAFDGTSAVIAFFIISGFVIHYPNKNGRGNLKEFWIRRFIRIIVPLSVILFTGTYFGHPEKAVVWSIFCELIYYAIYPLLSAIVLSWKTKFLISYVVAAILICLLAGHEISALFKQTDIKYHGYYWQLGIYFTWIIGLPCWLLGVLIAENVNDLRTVSFRKVIGYRVLIFLTSCFCCMAKFHLHISYIISMNIFSLLLYKWLQTEIVYYKNNKPYPILENMGKFSYSLYLCHPIIYLIIGLFITNTILTYPVIILLTLALSYAFFLTIEKPSHAIARRINNRFNWSVN